MNPSNSEAFDNDGSDAYEYRILLRDAGGLVERAAGNPPVTAATDSWRLTLRKAYPAVPNSPMVIEWFNTDGSAAPGGEGLHPEGEIRPVVPGDMPINLGPFVVQSRPADRQAESAGDGEVVTDGGSSMPQLALEHLKEAKLLDEKIGEWISEETGDDIGGMTDLYDSDHSIEESLNDIELGSFSLKEPEYIELLGILDTARQQAQDDPPTLGVINRLRMQVILANPEEYARIRAEMQERRANAEAAAKRQRNQQRSRQRMTDRAADLGSDAVDIEFEGEGSSE